MLEIQSAYQEPDSSGATLSGIGASWTGRMSFGERRALCGHHTASSTSLKLLAVCQTKFSMSLMGYKL